MANSMALILLSTFGGAVVGGIVGFLYDINKTNLANMTDIKSTKKAVLDGTLIGASVCGISQLVIQFILD